MLELFIRVLLPGGRGNLDTFRLLPITNIRLDVVDNWIFEKVAFHLARPGPHVGTRLLLLGLSSSRVVLSALHTLFLQVAHIVVDKFDEAHEVLLAEQAVLADSLGSLRAILLSLRSPDELARDAGHATKEHVLLVRVALRCRELPAQHIKLHSLVDEWAVGQDLEAERRELLPSLILVKLIDPLIDYFDGFIFCECRNVTRIDLFSLLGHFPSCNILGRILLIAL